MDGLLNALTPWRRNAGPRLKFAPILGPRGFYRLAYREWGSATNPRVLICVHGLTRLGRDFDHLAGVLARDYRVICPDMPGRGESDWFDHKMDYQAPNYVAACAALIARLEVERVDWLGTSMGGLVGMIMASMPNAPIARMVVNDIGPFVPKAAIERIASYTGTDPRFANLAEAEAMYRKNAAPFGIKRDDHWRHLTEISVRPADKGQLRLHYDPGVVIPIKSAPITDQAFWPVWDAIKCPVLVLRGTRFGSAAGADGQGNDRTRPQGGMGRDSGCGHAPALMEDDQIAIVRNWLAKGR